MRLKLDDAGHVVVTDGKPVYVLDDGKEVAFDAAATVARAEKAETKVAVNTAIARSPFLDKLALPTDIAVAFLGERFRLEGGKLVAYDREGSKLYSRARPGELADVDEALALLVDRDPERDRILKRPAGLGKAPATPTKGNLSSLSRAEFEALPPAKRMEHVKAGGAVVD